MVITVPFSFWKGGSIQVVGDYWRTDAVMFLLIGGLTTTWEEFERLIEVLAISCLLCLVMIKAYGELDINGRTTLPFGALANSNDYAAHLLMLLPSVLWVALTSKSLLMRIITICVIGYGIFAVLSSGSRGALISVAIGTLYFLIMASRRQRLVAACLMAIMLFATMTVLPKAAVQRLLSFSRTEDASEEAMESSDIRKRVLEEGISRTLENPIFGLGPGNFSNFEGVSEAANWAPPHNSYITVASECGIPGFLLFVSGVVLSFRTMMRIGFKFRRKPEQSKIAQAAICMQLMMVMFCVAVAFLNFAYSFHFPFLVGTSIAMAYTSLGPRSPSRAHTRVRSLDGREGNAEMGYLSV